MKMISRGIISSCFILLQIEHPGSNLQKGALRRELSRKRLRESAYRASYMFLSLNILIFCARRLLPPQAVPLPLGGRLFVRLLPRTPLRPRVRPPLLKERLTLDLVTNASSVSTFAKRSVEPLDVFEENSTVALRHALPLEKA